MKKLLLTFLVLSAGSAAYSQWTEQNTAFTTESRGINEIDIVDANTVWCVAYDGATPDNVIQEFTKTTDGGETWTAGSIDISDPSQAINNLSPVDGNTAFISAIDGTVGGGVLYKTTDGGISWDPTNLGSYLSATSFLNTVHFFDANNGLSEGDPIGSGAGDFEVYRTTDGGDTWTQVPGNDLPNPAGTVGNNGAEFGYNGGNVAAGNLFWFVTSAGKLYRTADMGGTWDKVNTPITDFGGVNVATSNGRVHFSNIDGTLTNAIGVLIATANATAPTPTYSRYTTANGGLTWSAATAYTAPYQNIDYIPGTTMLVGTGAAGTGAATVYTSAYSNDNGANWTVIDTGVQRTSVAFLDGVTGWAGGFNEDATTGGIYKYSGPALGILSVARQQFSATPNPTSGMLQVSNDNAAITNIAVYDILGKQVYNGKFSALNNVNVDLSALNTGSYILKATSDTGATQTIKIMKN